MLRSLDVKKAVGPDGVSPYILKYFCDELCRPVCLLFRRADDSTLIIKVVPSRDYRTAAADKMNADLGRIHS